MIQSRTVKPDYGNWVATKFIYGPGILGIIFLGLGFIFPLSLIIGALFLLLAAYFGYARYLFSTGGQKVQIQIWDLVPEKLDWNGTGQALDIGCGNGPLTIRLALDYPAAHIVGIDYWGGNWEFLKSVCEKNATLAGVGARVTFRKASASALPFGDESFDAVVSNLTFHEVGDSKDKRELIREALRVVKEGGKFAFQDLFLLKSVYGEMDDLLATMLSWGIKRAEFINTGDSSFIPAALKLPFMVGSMGMICGEK